MESRAYTRTGIKGVDDILDGKGVPQGYIVFTLGSPGSGKTTLAIQYLSEGARSYDENGLYISLDEDPKVLRSNARAFGWDLESLEREKKLAVIDASPIRQLKGEVTLGELSIGAREFKMVSLIEAIKKGVDDVNAKRLVIDSITPFILQHPDESDRRTALLDLMQAITQTGCTTLVLSELAETGVDRSYQFEEYLAQGVLLLRRTIQSGAILRVFSVEKMRGINHDHQPHPYKITESGIEVYPSEIAL